VIFHRPRSSSSRACLAASAWLTLRGVGVNPTRTGLLEMLRLMGADIRVEPRATQARPMRREPIADIHVRASALQGIRVPERLVPLAIDEFPVFFIAAAAARGRDAGDGSRRAARQGERSARRHGRGLQGRWASNANCWPTACASRAERAARRGASTATAITASRWRSRSRASVRTAEHRDRGRRQCRDLISRLSGNWPARSAWHCRSWREHPAARSAAPVVTIDGPSGSGKGTVSRLLARSQRLASARQRCALPAGGTGRQPCRRASEDVAAHAQLARRMRVVFESDPLGAERVLLEGSEVTGPLRTEAAGAGASRVAAWPAVREALLERQRAFARPRA
jgi:hypothetical protein